MCWNDHMVHGSWPRATHRREPVRAPAAEVRVSDAERDEVVQQLSRHTGDGRLTFEEFEERVGEVYAAKTRRELDATLRNLPRTVARTARSRGRVDIAGRLRPLLGIGLLVLAVVAVGPWVLWFAIPFLWCRVVGRGHRHHRHHRRQWHHDAVNAPGSEEDELTLV